MKITARQLRALVAEACGLENYGEESMMQPPMQPPVHQVAVPPGAMDHFAAVPVPEDYDKVRDFLEATPGLPSMQIDMIRQAAGAGCERSTAQAIIDHLKDTASSQAIIERFDPAAKSVGEDKLRRAVLTFVDEYSLGMELDPSSPGAIDSIKLKINELVDQVLG